MSFPSLPIHGQFATVNNNRYQYDSDLNRWQLIKSSKQDALYSAIDSEVNILKSLIFQNASSAGHPVGSVMAFASADMPAGFLYADGTRFNTTVYPQLYEFLGTDILPNLTNRDLGFRIYDQNDETDQAVLYFGIAGFDGAGVSYDSDLIATFVDLAIADRDSDINALKNRVTELEDDLAQAVADRVYTDNTLTARLDGHDSDIALRGRFYVQANAPSGGPNSGWVNTNTMRLHVWDESASTWIEVALT